jgi:Ca2+-binding RTX toxin-like protein
MGTMTFHAAINMLTDDVWSGAPISSEPTFFAVLQGVRTSRYFGTFTYPSGTPVGTLTGLLVELAPATVIVEASGLSADISAIAAQILQGNFTAALAIALADADTLNGSTGDDLLTSYAGNDRVNGNAGGDELLGGLGVDRLFGGLGRDVLRGEDGNDRLIGGAEADTMLGGAGADDFIFTALAESGLAISARDRIQGFQRGSDDINIAAIDAKPGGADNAFKFIGAQAFTAAGQVRVIQKAAERWVELNTDADAQAEMRIVLSGTGALTAGDFVL